MSELVEKTGLVYPPFHSSIPQLSPDLAKISTKTRLWLAIA